MIAGRYKGGPVPEGMKLFTFPKPCPLDDIAFVTQPRITKMESNEDNLKLSTMKKAAEAMNCEFVYYFKHRCWLQMDTSCISIRIIMKISTEMIWESILLSQITAN